MKKIGIFITIFAISLLIIFTSSYLGNKFPQGNVVLNNQSQISESALSNHNTETDCWVAYKGKVYDITSWLQKHPGGVNAILPYCGTSSAFQEAFTKKHGTTKVALLMKVGELIGDLKYQGQLAQ